MQYEHRINSYPKKCACTKQTSSSLTATSIFPFYCVYQLYAQWGDWRTLQTLSWFNNISFLTIDFNNSIAIHCSIGVWMLMWPVGSLTCEPTIWNHFNHDNVSTDIILFIWPFHQLCIVSTSYSFKFVFCVTLDCWLKHNFCLLNKEASQVGGNVWWWGRGPFILWGSQHMNASFQSSDISNHVFKSPLLHYYIVHYLS